MISALALGPTSRVQAKDPMFSMVKVNLGDDLTRYVEESVVAVTPMLASGHRPAGSATTPEALGVGAGTLVAAALALVETAGDGWVVGAGSEPPASIHQSPMMTVRETRITAPRRTQYTVGASGPLGDIIALTQATVVP
ncbi:unannotated protein [freshwater metagenome]|uniref:Unannotated protein n=1 Tax=freshwater metagenome TaxID=449393 RepID=A0A6J7F289_9ZZZZ